MASSPTDNEEEPIPTSLTDYERLRLENMKRNQAMIEALHIRHVKSQMQLTSGKLRSIRGGKKLWPGEVVPRRLRSSTRIHYTTGDTCGKNCPSSVSELARRIFALEDTKQSVSLSTVYIQGSNDKLISQLQRADENTPLSHLPSMKSSPPGLNIEPSQFSLQKCDIARVVPERITSASFLPIAEQLFLVAGDTDGNLGFWNVDSEDPEGDLVHIYQPHAAPVSGISFGSFRASKVFTCSFDETIKQLDVETSMFNLMYCSKGNHILSAICSAPSSPFCVYIAEGPGILKMFDAREKRDCLCVDIHHRTINTIDMNMHSPWLMVTSSTDKRVCMWDVRKLEGFGDRVHSIQHQEAVHSAQFSPSGSLIATCSFDNTVAIARTYQQRLPVFVAHPNKNQRGISTFRAIWGWDDNYLYVGNAKRSIDIISTKFEIECHWLSSPLMSSIPSRLAAHPLRQGLLAGCSQKGEVFLWRQEEC